MFSYGSDNRATPADEAPQDCDDRDEQEEVNQSSSHVEDAEPEEPGDDQDDRQGDQHDVILQVNDLQGPSALREPGGWTPPRPASMHHTGRERPRESGVPRKTTGSASWVKSPVRLDCDLVRKDYSIRGMPRGR